MKSIAGVGLAEVVSVYSGTQGEFMQLLFGQQLHIGGMKASIDLADRAGIGAGFSGVDLCCCNGAGMRFWCGLARSPRWSVSMRPGPWYSAGGS